MATNAQPARRIHNHKSFADFIASDDELFIFRRFDRLNARSLLYLQSELMTLEAQLAEFDAEDAADSSTDKDVMLSTKCWETLEARAAVDQPREAERLELIRRIQDTTYRYNKALVVQGQLQQMGVPKKRVWEVYTNWFRQSKPFVGHSRNLLNDEADFVSLVSSAEHDVLTRTVEYLTGMFKVWKQSSKGPGNVPVYYQQHTVHRLITLVSIVGATLLLEAAIVGLYLVENDHVRFGLIAVFIALFAAVISLFSNARRAEMFAATAAYAAVLVVFVSGNLNNGGSRS